MSEANPIGLGHSDGLQIGDKPRSASWSQEALFGVAQVVLTPKLIIDGPAGSIVASLTLQDFPAGEWLACEVRPGLRFPQDLDLALDWITALARAWCDKIAPF